MERLIEERQKILRDIKDQNPIFKFPIITIVGSTHYHMDEIDKRRKELSEDAIVLAPHKSCSVGNEEKCLQMFQQQIYMSDKVVVENVNGYVGTHTQTDIEFANSIGVPVEYMYDIPNKKIPNIRPGSLLFSLQTSTYFFVINAELDNNYDGKTFLYARTSRVGMPEYDLNPKHGMVVADGAQIVYSRILNLIYDNGVLFNFMGKPVDMSDWMFVKQVDDEILNQFIKADDEYHSRESGWMEVLPTDYERN